MPLRVGVLGPVTVWRDGREIAAGQPRQLAVLGMLVSQANHVVSRSELVDAVWGEEPPATAEGGIYTYVAGLRRVLEPDRPRLEPGKGRRARASVLISSGGGYLLRLGPGGLDAEQFEELLGRSRALRADGDASGAARAVSEALALWRGQPFAGVPGPFAAAERQRLTELRTAALEERADLMLAQGAAVAAIPELTGLAAEYPLRERTQGLLMIALYRCGRQAEALGVFRDVRERLADELGIDPGAELTRIHQQVLATDPELDEPAREAAGPLPRPAPPLAAMMLSAPVAPPGPALAPPALAPPAPVAPVPSSLPPGPAGFVGRDAELRALRALLPGPAPVALITGSAGVGKTTLAIRFARQVMPLFPDGQLYVNLRGFDPASAPMAPATALEWFFDALGVPATQVPAALEARSALLRTLLEGRRVLLLLDNAHDAEQVRPLLPGAAGCLVLVTSRSQLTGLVVEGACPVPLDVLGPGEAAELVAARLGAERAGCDPAAVAALARHSAGLPLALSVTCARAVARPAMRLADLAAELADVRGRLDALATGEATTDLRAVFSWSYDKLSRPAALLFRLLGLHQGPDIAVAAAASLAGLSPALARTALAELARSSLVNEDSAGRFGFHDLLRAYAAELAAATLDDAERDLAGRRVLDYYLWTAHAAAGRLYPARGLMPLPAPAGGVTAEVFSGPAAYEHALAWFDAEHLVLRGVIEHAAGQRRDEHCWKLAWCWAPLLHRRGRLHETLAVQRTAALAAGRLGDRDALAHVHVQLGRVSGSLRDYDAADEHLRLALELFTDLGDLRNVSQARYGLAVQAAQQERYEEALDHASDSLRLRRTLADDGTIAYSENVVGWILAHLGQPDMALWYCRRALDLHQQWGSRSGEADTLDSIAYAYLQLRDYEQAIAHYEQAVELYQLLGDPQGEANSRLCLGDVQSAAGLAGAAERSWERALVVLAGVQGADMSAASGRLRVKLRSVVHGVSWGEGADAGHAQPGLAAREHPSRRDSPADKGRLSGPDAAARAGRGRARRAAERYQPARHQVANSGHGAGARGSVRLARRRRVLHRDESGGPGRRRRARHRGLQRAVL